MKHIIWELNSMTCLVVPTNEKECAETIKKYEWRNDMATCDEWKVYLIVKRTKWNTESDTLREIKCNWWKIAIIKGVKDSFYNITLLN
jgi:hypothetical protein